MSGYVHAYTSFAVTGTIETKRIDFGLPGEGKTISEIQYEGYAPDPVTITVSVSLDGGVNFYEASTATVVGYFRAFAFPWRTAESFIIRFQGAPLYISNIVVQAIPNPGEYAPGSTNIVSPNRVFNKHWIDVVTPSEGFEMKNLGWLESATPTEHFETIGPGFLIADTSDNEVVLYTRFSVAPWYARYGEAYPDPHYVHTVNDICNDRTHLYFTDAGTHDKIVKLKCLPKYNGQTWDLEYVSEIGSTGSGNDEMEQPFGICTDGTYLYVADTYNHRIVKRLNSTLEYVAQVGTRGAGDNQFEYPSGICTDGTYLYITDTNNHRIKKHKCSDLSFVSKFGSFAAHPGDDEFRYPYGIATHGGSVYLCDNYNRVKKHKCSDLSFEAQVDGFSDIFGCCVAGGSVSGKSLYVIGSIPAELSEVSLSDLSIIQQSGELTGLNVPMGIDSWQGPVP